MDSLSLEFSASDARIDAATPQAGQSWLGIELCGSFDTLDRSIRFGLRTGVRCTLIECPLCAAAAVCVIYGQLPVSGRGNRSPIANSGKREKHPHKRWLLGVFFREV
jgi:hypothetical protein